MRIKYRFLLLIGFAALLPPSAFAQVSLGTAQGFGVLAGQTVTNTGTTTVTGDVGTSPGSSVTGFPPGIVLPPGTIHLADGVAGQAQSDLTTAYNAAAGTACTVDLTGQDLGGLTLTPGVYCFDVSAQLTGAMTLDFQGNPNALFIFKTGSTLTTASGSSVVLANNGGGSCPANLFWQIGSSATLGSGTSFVGNILALTSITLNAGSVVNGRTLARNGAVTLSSNTVTACAPTIVCPVITVNPATLPPAVSGVAYNQTVTASGGTGPYTFAITAGTLPVGLVLNTETGAITGTPGTTGLFSLTIQASDSTGCLGSRPYSGTGLSAANPVPGLGPIGLVFLVILLAGVGLYRRKGFSA